MLELLLRLRQEAEVADCENRRLPNQRYAGHDVVRTEILHTSTRVQKRPLTRTVNTHDRCRGLRFRIDRYSLGIHAMRPVVLDHEPPDRIVPQSGDDADPETQPGKIDANIR